MTPAPLVAALLGGLAVALAVSAATPRSSRRPPPGPAAPSPAGRSSPTAADPPSGVARVWRLGPRRVAEQAPAVTPDAAAEWCDGLARRVRSGATLREALVEPAPTDRALAAALSDARLALERGGAVTDLPEHVPDPPTRRSGREHVDLVLAVAGACALAGGPAAEPLDRTAAALRLRAADRAERAAQTAQARLSAHVMTIVPLAALALAGLGDPRVRVTVTAPAGAACVLVGAALNALGWIWMRRIVAGPS